MHTFLVQLVIFYLHLEYAYTYKKISTKERIFVSLVSPSGSGKSHLIHEWLTIGTFQPELDNFFFYQQYQSLFGLISKDVKKIEFIEGVEFEFIQNLPNNGTKYLLIFDESC